VVNDDFFVACLDLGHAEMQGSGSGAVNMIHALGDKLQALHIHDCDRQYDSHQIPFSMNVDFEAVVKALKDIHYCGWFTLEASSYLSAFDPDTAFRGVQDLANAARKLARMFDALDWL
jgi:sugar phosphate isomerase/epimerase